ncbi:MAG: class II aldolase/adducin family protein [Kiritimatiellae bacterium]|nr:class II aldolase/adducin family protein [Kiritimatiellia bacterium]
MADIRGELVNYGKKIARSGLVAGAGGNISARDGKIIWMKPSGFAMDEMRPADLCGMDLKSGRQIAGKNKPTSEFNMHLAIYRVRPEITAVFHTHSPWASGVISAGVKIKPMFAEFINDLGRVTTIPYVTPTTMELAQAVKKAARNHDTIFMVNHGVLAVGQVMKQAFYRCLVVEHAAISLAAAAITGHPRFLSKKQQADLMKLDAPKHRLKMMQA